MSFRCDTPGTDDTNRRHYATEAAALREERRLRLEGKRDAVATPLRPEYQESA